MFGRLKKIQEKLRINKEAKEIQKSAKIHDQNYQSAKHAFTYFSSDKLFAELKEIKSQSPVDMMKMMAAEEVLIERGVLDHSIAHEHFNDFRKANAFDSKKEQKRNQIIELANPLSETYSSSKKIDSKSPVNNYKYQDQIFLNVLNSGLKSSLNEMLNFRLKFRIVDDMPTVSFYLTFHPSKLKTEGYSDESDFYQSMNSEFQSGIFNTLTRITLVNVLNKSFIRLGYFKVNPKEKIKIDIYGMRHSLSLRNEDPLLNSIELPVI
jgi:hypothetical protein